MTLTPEQTEALEKLDAGTHVLVPVECKPKIIGAFWRVKNGFHYHGEPKPTDTSDYASYRAMIQASQEDG